MTRVENEFSRLVEERQGELLELLSDLVRFPTVSPPARNTVEV